VSRYDGENRTTFTTEDGLAGNLVEKVLEDRDGRIWAATFNGLSRYDGKSWVSFTTRDGLASNSANQIIQDRQGQFWIGPFNGGVSRYDGQVFQTTKKADGLAGRKVYDILEADSGEIWFAIDGGVSRYRPPDDPEPPSMLVDAVLADRRYLGSKDLELPSGLLVIFEFHGISFKTRPGELIFRYRLKGHHEDWRTTRTGRVEYEDLPTGDFVFEIEAVDRDLNYSAEPATLRLTIHPPYAQWALICGSLLVLLSSGYAIRKRRQAGLVEHELDATRTELGRERRRHIEVRPHDIELWTVDDFVETSGAMQRVFAQIRDLGQDDRTALIIGESGVGKELVARAIHEGRSRHDQAFVPLRCAAFPTDVAESLERRTATLSDLFGHTKGAFPGADSNKDGLIHQAQGGTLFLDEVGVTPLPLQASLLRVLQRGEVRRIGETTGERLDVHVLAATSEDLDVLVGVGGINRELYEYLTISRLSIPPLRERPEDVELLARGVTDEAMAQLGKAPMPLSREVLTQLQSYAFPGNVRELRQVLESAIRAKRGESLGPEDFLFLSQA